MDTVESNARRSHNFVILVTESYKLDKTPVPSMIFRRIAYSTDRVLRNTAKKQSVDVAKEKEI